METHSSAIVATSTTAATSVAEIEKFLSRRQVATAATVCFVNGNH